MIKIGSSWNQEYLKELTQEQLDFLEDLQNGTLLAKPIAGMEISTGINWAKLFNDHNISNEELDRFCVRGYFGMQDTNIDPNDGFKAKKTV